MYRSVECEWRSPCGGLCALSGVVQKPVVQSAVPSSTVDTTDSENTVSDAERTPVTHDVEYVTDAAHFSGSWHFSDLQNPSTSSHSRIVAGNNAESEYQPSQSAEETPPAHPSDELSFYEMCASPPPSDCLNSDIWLSSAAVDLGSPLMLRGSGSCTLMQHGT